MADKSLQVTGARTTASASEGGGAAGSALPLLATISAKGSSGGGPLWSREGLPLGHMSQICRQWCKSLQQSRHTHMLMLSMASQATVALSLQGRRSRWDRGQDLGDPALPGLCPTLGHCNCTPGYESSTWPKRWTQCSQEPRL